MKTDTATQGNWLGVYGNQGYDVIGKPAIFPSYATVTPAGQSTFTWAATTTDPRAFRHQTVRNRIAATWYSTTSFTIAVNLNDGQAHNIALYALDWDNNGRSEQIQITSAATGAILDTETISSFSGRSLSPVEGQRERGDPGHADFGSERRRQWPVLRRCGRAGCRQSIQRQRPGGDDRRQFVQHHRHGEGLDRQRRHRLHRDGALHQQLDPGALPANYTFLAGDNGTHTFSATLNTGGLQSITATDVAVGTISGSTSTTVTSASLVKRDTATQGNWIGVYGKDGYDVIGKPASIPSYATVTPAGQTTFTWAATTTDPRCACRHLTAPTASPLPGLRPRASRST